jgi:hypothetical protein
MPSRPPKTRFERYRAGLLDNSLVAVALVISGFVVGIGAFTGALSSTWEFVDSRAARRALLPSCRTTIPRPHFREGLQNRRDYLLFQTLRRSVSASRDFNS